MMMPGVILMASINLKDAFKSVKDAFDGIQSTALTIVIALIVVGSVMGAVTTGAIPLPTAFNAVLTALVTTISGWFTTGSAVVTTVVALIVVVVLIVLFRNGKDSSGSIA